MADQAKPTAPDWLSAPSRTNRIIGSIAGRITFARVCVRRPLKADARLSQPERQLWMVARLSSRLLPERSRGDDLASVAAVWHSDFPCHEISAVSPACFRRSETAASGPDSAVWGPVLFRGNASLDRGCLRRRRRSSAPRVSSRAWSPSSAGLGLADPEKLVDQLLALGSLLGRVRHLRRPGRISVHARGRWGTGGRWLLFDGRRGNGVVLSRRGGGDELGCGHVLASNKRRWVEFRFARRGAEGRGRWLGRSGSGLGRSGRP